jgi:hypothetical protein
MDGNKFRLFCLGISFISWTTLCVLPTLIVMFVIIGMTYKTQQLTTLLWIIPAGIPGFIGSLFLKPYVEAANAAFYRDVSGTAEVPALTLPNASEEHACGTNEEDQEQSVVKNEAPVGHTDDSSNR